MNKPTITNPSTVKYSKETWQLIFFDVVFNCFLSFFSKSGKKRFLFQNQPSITTKIMMYILGKKVM